VGRGRSMYEKCPMNNYLSKCPVAPEINGT
jgi:hypothetical protein